MLLLLVGCVKPIKPTFIQDKPTPWCFQVTFPAGNGVMEQSTICFETSASCYRISTITRDKGKLANIRAVDVCWKRPA